MNKKEWLDKLYYDYGMQQYDFELCSMYKKDGETICGKWKKYSDVAMPLNPWEDRKLWKFNNRTILPNEIVLDIEDPKQYPEILRELIILKLKFLSYSTGSRGYHIHIFSKTPYSGYQKSFFVDKFGTDMAKAGERVMIALEFCPHWKTGKPKELLYGKI